MQTLFYHKCQDCLTAFTCDVDKVDCCDCGSDSITFMGQVYGNKYVQIGNRAPCDGRCTHASGPHCDCGCQGANHGTGRLVKVKIHEGKIKAEGFTMEDIERGIRYRKTVEYAQKMVDLVQDSWKQRGLQRALDKIEGMKQYDPRLQALFDFITKNG